jgi:hypothetical protein
MKATPDASDNELEKDPVASSHEGQLVSAPAIPAATENTPGSSASTSASASATTSDAPVSPGDARAVRQALTGRAAREAKKIDRGQMSPGQLAWHELKKNRAAMAGLWILAFLYLSALFAPFLSPYNPTDPNPAAARWVTTRR